MSAESCWRAFSGLACESPRSFGPQAAQSAVFAEFIIDGNGVDAMAVVLQHDSLAAGKADPARQGVVCQFFTPGIAVRRRRTDEDRLAQRHDPVEAEC